MPALKTPQAWWALPPGSSRGLVRRRRSGCRSPNCVTRSPASHSGANDRDGTGGSISPIRATFRCGLKKLVYRYPPTANDVHQAWQQQDQHSQSCPNQPKHGEFCKSIPGLFRPPRTINRMIASNTPESPGRSSWPARRRAGESVPGRCRRFNQHVYFSSIVIDKILSPAGRSPLVGSRAVSDSTTSMPLMTSPKMVYFHPGQAGHHR